MVFIGWNLYFVVGEESCFIGICFLCFCFYGFFIVDEFVKFFLKIFYEIFVFFGWLIVKFIWEVKECY